MFRKNDNEWIDEKNNEEKTNHIIPSNEKIYEEEEDEWWDLYILINRSSNQFITEKQAEQYFKDNVYHTIWKYEWWMIYIFDLEKNSLLPEIRFLDGFSNEPIKEWFNPFWTWFLVILWLVWVFVYFQFFYEDNSEEWNPITNIINPVWEEEKSIIDTIVPLPLNPVPVENIQKPVVECNNLELEDKLWMCEKQVNKLLNTNEFLELDFSLVEKKLNVCSSNLLDLQNEFEDINMSRDNVLNMLDEQKKMNLTDNQLFLSIWKYIFDICEEKSSDTCLKLIYNFYNERD